MIGIIARALRLKLAGELAEDVLTDILTVWLRDIETKVRTSDPLAAVAYWDSVLMLLDVMQQHLGVNASIEHEQLRGLVLRMHIDTLGGER